MEKVARNKGRAREKLGEHVGKGMGGGRLRKEEKKGGENERGKKLGGKVH